MSEGLQFFDGVKVLFLGEAQVNYGVASCDEPVIIISLAVDNSKRQRLVFSQLQQKAHLRSMISRGDVKEGTVLNITAQKAGVENDVSEAEGGPTAKIVAIQVFNSQGESIASLN